MGKNNTLNTTELMTGKDGRLFVEFNGVNIDLAEISNFAVNMNFRSVEKQPVGSVTVHSVPTGVSFAMSFTEMVIRDDVIMAPLLEALKNGVIPNYNFQGVAYKPDGQEQRVALNHVVPNGEFGLMSLTPGEVIERPQSFAINSVPEFIKSLASTYIK